LTVGRYGLGLAELRVEAGGKGIIAQAGTPVARLVPVKKERKLRRDRLAGFLEDEIWIGPDFDAPLPEEILSAWAANVIETAPGHPHRHRVGGQLAASGYEGASPHRG
jgi:antitoxin (DNA-binding transcriptional repressor) of toxin-antitoxin stability system